MAANDFAFYALAFTSLLFSVGVLTLRNPIYCALCLAVTMVSIAGIFVTLNAYFIAGVQLIVYAGAVAVLFVMVLMLFDLRHEMKTYSKGLISNFLKLISSGMLLGMLLIYIWYSFSSDPGFKPLPSDPKMVMEGTREVAMALFTRYFFAFESIGVLLTVIAVGAVTLSRIQGGTHADT